MIYVLIQNNKIIEKRDFNYPPPTLSPIKGLKWYKYAEMEPPLFDPVTQVLREVNPEIVNDNANQQWEVFELPESEIALNMERETITIRENKKADRASSVANIKVTTTSGKVFDGDEESQTRMTRAILGLQATNTPSITWVLADNTPTNVTAVELTEALVLAGQRQSELWVI